MEQVDRLVRVLLEACGQPLAPEAEPEERAVGRLLAPDGPSCAALIASATHSTAGRRFVERMCIVSASCCQQRHSRLALLDAALIAARIVQARCCDSIGVASRNGKTLR